MAEGETKATGKSKLTALLLAGVEREEIRTDLVSVLVFSVAGKAFAVGVEHTEGVVDCPRITPLPSAPDMIVGVASVRGRITLVVDLNQAANYPLARKRLILLRGEAQLGLLADVVEGVIALEPEAIRTISQERRSLFSRTFNKSEIAWPSQSQFDHNGQQIPIIDSERLIAALK
jgi:chemotaxis signal transduction protein